MLSSDKQIELMKMVLGEVERAVENGDNPFAGVLIDEKGSVVVKAHNLQVSTKDRTAHAEVLLIRWASEKFKKIYFPGYSIVLNSEPCSMCMSLLVKAKIDAVYYGASQDIGNDPPIPASEIVAMSNHKVKLIGGIMESECKEMIAVVRKQPFIK